MVISSGLQKALIATKIIVTYPNIVTIIYIVNGADFK